MSEWIDELSNDIDKLLLEIGFTGALYGAGDLCSPVYTYLRTNERCAKAAVLAEGLSLISLKQFDQAVSVLDDFMAADGVEEYVDAALAYKLMALKLRGDASASAATRDDPRAGALTASMSETL